MEDREPVALHPPVKAGTPLPEKVAERLRQYQRQMQELQASQQQYILGVLEALGIEGKVEIDVSTMTYRAKDE